MTYAQAQMNPQNQDYGQKLQLASALLFEQTLGNAYFWVTAISLGTSASLVWFIAFLLQQRQRRELISAKFLAWYHNELVCLRQVIKNKSSIETASVQADEVKKNESADLLAELSRLRQQVTSQEAAERVLREQINSLSKKLGEEKQRNKSVKIP